MTPEAFVAGIAATLEPRRNPAQAGPMARYLRDQFPFLGLKRPEFQPLTRPHLRACRGQVDEAWVVEAADRLWRLPEREYRYVAIDLLATQLRTLTPASLPRIEEWIVTDSWWDSVDGLVGHVVGPLVRRHPGLPEVMDLWSVAPNFWLRRTAILHQLGHKKDTDTNRLFGYCRANAADPEFFVRKAIGWALRTHARTDPTAVRAFVAANQGTLSALSVREALRRCQAVSAPERVGRTSKPGTSG